MTAGQQDVAQLNALLDQFNALAEQTGVTPFKMALVAPLEILPTPKNARYMPKRVFDQLTANLKADGNLAGHYPFCWRDDAGKFHLLSGNHRVKAAIEAGVPLIIVTYTDKVLSEDEQVARQLAHNALAGMDNPVTLKELWENIQGVEYKIFTGIDAEMLKQLTPVDLAKVDSAKLVFEQLVLYFLPSELDRIEQLVKQLAVHQKALKLAADYKDWDAFFETLLKFKSAERIVNSATALRVMCEIVEDWLGENATT